MATQPEHDTHRRYRWPRKGRAMPEDEYHDLERVSPDRKYEYLEGIAYLKSGDSVAHDRITRNVGNVLDNVLPGGCAAFGVDVQEIVLLSQFAQHVEVWRRNEQEPDNPKAWGHTLYDTKDVLQLSSIAVTIPIEQFYRGLSFDEGEEEV